MAKVVDESLLVGTIISLDDFHMSLCELFTVSRYLVYCGVIFNGFNNIIREGGSVVFDMDDYMHGIKPLDLS